MRRQNEEAPLIEEVGVALDNESVELVKLRALRVQVRLKEALPVDGQLALDQVQDAELHRIHAFLLRHGDLEELRGQVLSPEVRKLLLENFASFALFAVLDMIKILHAVKSDDLDLAHIGLSVVEAELHTELARLARLERLH